MKRKRGRGGGERASPREPRSVSLEGTLCSHLREMLGRGKRAREIVDISVIMLFKHYWYIEIAAWNKLHDVPYVDTQDTCTCTCMCCFVENMVCIYICTFVYSDFSLLCAILQWMLTRTMAFLFSLVNLTFVLHRWSRISQHLPVKPVK